MNKNKSTINHKVDSLIIQVGSFFIATFICGFALQLDFVSKGKLVVFVKEV